MIIMPMIIMSMVVMSMVAIIHWSDITRSGVARYPSWKRRDWGRLRSTESGRDSQSCDRNRKYHSNHTVLLGREVMSASEIIKQHAGGSTTSKEFLKVNS
jgi:hypothetical protein